MLGRSVGSGNDVPSPLAAWSWFLSILFKAVLQEYCYTGLFHFFCTISDSWQSWLSTCLWLVGTSYRHMPGFNHFPKVGRLRTAKPLQAGQWLNKLDALVSRRWMPACLEQHCGFFSSGFADDSPSCTWEECCPSHTDVLPSLRLSLGHPSRILLTLEESHRWKAGRWWFGRSHPLRSTVHRSH